MAGKTTVAPWLAGASTIPAPTNQIKQVSGGVVAPWISAPPVTKKVVAPVSPASQVKVKQPSATPYILPAIGDVLGSLKDAPKSFYNAVKNLPIVNQLTPMGQTIQQIAQAPVQGQIVKNTDALTKARLDLVQHVSDQLKKPGITPAQRENYRNILKGEIKQFQDTSKTVDQNVTSGLTQGKLAVDAAFSTVAALSGYNPALNGLVGSGTLASADAVKAANTLKKIVEATDAAGRVARYGKAGEVANAALKYGVPAAKDLAINEGLLTGAEMSQGKKFSDAAQQSLPLASGLAALPLVGAVAIAGVAKTLDASGKLIGKGLDNAATKLEDVAAGKNFAEKQTNAGSVTEKVLANTVDKPTVGQKIAGKLATGIRNVQSIPQKYVDRFTPFFDIQKRIREITGQPVAEDLKIGRNARVATDVATNTSTRDLQALFGENGKGGALSPYNDLNRQILAREHILDQIDRVNLGQSITGRQVTPSTKDSILAELNKTLVQHTAELGPNEQRLQEALKIRADYNRSLLDKAYQSGFIDKVSYAKIIETHPNYIPHSVVQDVTNEVNLGVSGNLNPKQPVVGATGSTRQLENTDQAIIGRTAQVNKAVENNNVVGGLVKAQEQFKAVPGMRQVTTGAPAGRGEQVISYFRNGVKESWVVPNDVAVAVKNLDAQTIPSALKWITAPQRLLKRFATKYNLSFSIPNLARDRQEAAVTAKAFIEALAKESGAKPNVVNLSEKEIRDLYLRSGGYGGSSIMNEGTNNSLKQLESKGIVKTLTDKVNPAKVIENINQEIEFSTREAVFRQGLERGLSPKDAAFASREATVDFSKMGTHMRVLNEMIPFLNARVQGTVNLFSSAKASPEIFARRMYWTAVLPQLGLYDWNRQFKSSQNIPEYIRQNYWVIVTGEVKGRDTNGNAAILPKMITIKKGQMQQLISNPIEYFLAKNDKNDPRNVTQMITDVLGSASPVSVGTGIGYSNFWLGLISQAGPLANVAVGLGANVDPYRGNTIIPTDRLQASPGNRTSPYDPKVLQALGKKFNISPAQMDFAINSLGGGAGDITALTDLLYRAKSGIGLNLNPNEPSAFGQATRLPVSGKVLRETTPQNNPNYQANLQKKVQLNQGVQDARLATKDAATALDQKLLGMKSSQERTTYLNSLGSALTPDIKKQLKAITTARTSAGILRTTDSADLRARYIDLRLRELKQAGLSQQQLTDYLDSLESQKILTKSVKQKIAQIQQSFK